MYRLETTEFDSVERGSTPLFPTNHKYYEIQLEKLYKQDRLISYPKITLQSSIKLKFLNVA